jgi:serine/threonine-protein kinase/endoribonuclease IRE1
MSEVLHSPTFNFYSYIGMELWVATLEQLINGDYSGPPVGSDKEILLQIARAVNYLSDRGLVNRNIRPENILISEKDGNDPPRIKLVDFSVSRKLKSGQSELENSGQLQKNGWAAPELIDGERYEPAVDVFSAGCVFAYLLSRGRHPFGPFPSQVFNAVNGILCIPPEITDQTAIDLITNMCKTKPEERINIKEVLIHPYFWDEQKCMKFIDAVVGLIEPEWAVKGPLYETLNSVKDDIFRGYWTDRLTEHVKHNIFRGKAPMKDRDEEKTSLFHLLKSIRNKVT